MKITLQEYQNSWKTVYDKENTLIASALKKWKPQIEHIGSTAVPGLKAKPIIDILIGLDKEVHLDEIIGK